MLKERIRRLLLPVTDLLLKEEVLRNHENGSINQKLIALHYQALAAAGAKPLRLKDSGFRVFSEFEEDGILLLLFSVLGSTNRVCVEICAGNGMQCNTANLIINHGWWGHLFDGDEQNVTRGRNFFGRHRDTFLSPPQFTHAWITAENVNELVAASGASGEVDLLSLDIDGMDYWVWKALTAIQPRVIVCEVANSVPPSLALTVPYDANFVADDSDYRGASLRAMTKLGKEKGYRLVGTHRYGFNAFFVKCGLGEDVFPEVSPEDCANDAFTAESIDKRWPRMKDRPWVEV